LALVHTLYKNKFPISGIGILKFYWYNNSDKEKIKTLLEGGGQRLQRTLTQDLRGSFGFGY